MTEPEAAANTAIVAHGEDNLARAGTNTAFLGERKGRGEAAYQVPVFGIEAHGSCAGFGSPRCRSSMEMPSGERMKAM